MIGPSDPGPAPMAARICSSAPSLGHCNTMGTASTMNALTEALGMMLPGMVSGWLQELMGYRNFFLWVTAATLPSFLVAALIPLKPGFGRKEKT